MDYQEFKVLTDKIIHKYASKTVKAILSKDSDYEALVFNKLVQGYNQFDPQKCKSGVTRTQFAVEYAKNGLSEIGREYINSHRFYNNVSNLYGVATDDFEQLELQELIDYYLNNSNLSKYQHRYMKAYIEGDTIAEIARMYHKAHSTVSNTLQLAKDKIKAIHGESFEQICQI